MGLGGISIWQLVIVLAIVLVVFGTKRLKGLGGEVGGAIKGFKHAMNEEPESLEKAEASTVKADVKSTDSVS
ncbi:twin-arginine translocase TatA/TatE family subunit [Saccharospirillum salsuginis]|uniref:Sec-independent protein translocase protein TatA n=1 Tax=Saccharospirillum salsuginis TaxID=418750 RepID=A0A918JZP4_9GAMM|nr:twin-arginine translocase TatA/TatE family subunit [Saccharospirillum salsuginis]GGX39679.1 hypothetical protein GCM10007392_02710 [Saccharospirillum salsuginis]